MNISKLFALIAIYIFTSAPSQAKMIQWERAEEIFVEGEVISVDQSANLLQAYIKYNGKIYFCLAHFHRVGSRH